MSLLFKWSSGVYHLLLTSCTHRGQRKILGIREIIARFEFLTATKSSGLLCLVDQQLPIYRRTVVPCSFTGTVTDLLNDCCTFALNNKHFSSASTKHFISRHDITSQKT